MGRVIDVYINIHICRQDIKVINKRSTKGYYNSLEEFEKKYLPKHYEEKQLHNWFLKLTTR